MLLFYVMCVYHVYLHVCVWVPTIQKRVVEEVGVLHICVVVIYLMWVVESKFQSFADAVIIYYYY